MSGDEFYNKIKKILYNGSTESSILGAVDDEYLRFIHTLIARRGARTNAIFLPNFISLRFPFVLSLSVERGHLISFSIQLHFLFVVPFLSPLCVSSTATAVDTTTHEDKKCDNERRYQNDQHITGNFALAVEPIFVGTITRNDCGPAWIFVALMIAFTEVALGI